MSRKGAHRDVVVPAEARGNDVGEGRMRIVVIGVDRYRGWDPLRNAVNDARGVLEVFESVGFQRAAEPLLDQAATGDALQGLVIDGLRTTLRDDDSLIVFFAGHGLTVTQHFADGPPHAVKGYLLPVDAERDRRSWLEIGPWLSDIAGLRARHILVILDSCHSGVALDREAHFRDRHPVADPTIDPLRDRRSRRVITSALGHQRAADGGPVSGHSLFAGCLIEAIRGGLSTVLNQTHTTGRFLGAYLQERVRQYSHEQIPDVGALEYHAEGELFVPLAPPGGKPKRPRPSAKSPAAQDRATDPLALHRAADEPKRNGKRQVFDRSANNPAPDRETDQPAHDRPTGTAAPNREAHQTALDRAADRAAQAGVSSRAEPKTGSGSRAVDQVGEGCEGWILDPAFVAALDRHGAERRSGGRVLSVVAGDALATQTAWATWAARHGYLTLTTEAEGGDAAVADLLAQVPWLRCLGEARRRLAAAARIAVEAVDAALDARSRAERRRWIDDVAARDLHARVSGWLLSSLRERSAQLPDLGTAPARGGQLLAIACDLACPTAVLVQREAPDAAWLERAIATAAALTSYLPRRSIAVAAPEELVGRVLHGGRGSAALTLARQGLVRMATPAQRSPGGGRRRTARVLLEALARDSRTRGRFVVDGQVAIDEGGPVVDVELLAPAARIAIALDGWHHFYDPEGYRRDRIWDRRLARAGYFVMRFLAEDVDARLASTLDQIALALASRRAQGGLS